MSSSEPIDQGAPPVPATKIVALLNQKGGVGKTTSTVNLGAALAEAGRRVCLIDLDPQAHLALHLGLEPEAAGHTVYDLLLDPDCSVEQTLVPARKNLEVIMSEVDLAGAESELAGVPDRQHRLREKLAPALSRWDVVLVDCPPSLGLLTLNALCLAREVYVPMQAHFLALQGVGRLLETVGLVGRSVNPDLRVTGIILCMYEGQTTLAKEVLADLEAFFAEAAPGVPWYGCRILQPPVRRNIKLAEAPSFGNTIFDYSPWCAGAVDYRMIARHLVESWDAQPAIDPAPAIDPSPAIDPAPSEDQASAKDPEPRTSQIVEVVATPAVPQTDPIR